MTRSLAILVLLTSVAPGMSAQSVDLDSFHLSQKYLARAARGDIVVRGLKTDDPREVAIVAAVLLPELTVDSRIFAGDLERLSAIPEARRFGVLRPDMLAEDLKALAIPAEDFRLIPRCQVGRCKIKLSEEVMDTLVSFDWSSQQSAALANTYMRNWFKSYLEAYWTQGDSALVVYVDQELPEALTTSLDHLLEHFGALRDGAPSLYRFLRTPNGASDTIESSYHWAIQKSELRPVMTLNHSASYHHVEGEQVTSWVVTKQLYASHYYLAGLRVWYVVNSAPELSTERPLLLYIDRSVFDGPIGGLRRTLLEYRMQQNVRERMAWLRDAVDREYGVGSPSVVGRNP